MKVRGLSRSIATLFVGALLAGGSALADTVTGPVDKAVDMQPAGTEVAREIHQFHTMLLWIITPITLFVLALLLYVMVFFNKRANPTPRKFTHNLFIEVVWTVIPVIILVVIASFSFPLLFKEEQIPKADLTIKATGNTWNWTYNYPDQNVEFTSAPLSQDEAKAQGRIYREAVDEQLVVPVGATVRVLITSNDVIHAFSVPSLGIKEDAIPGRVNETWFKVEKPGVYVGFCQELCGIGHSFMPIEVHAVSQADFATFITGKGGQLAAAPVAPQQTQAPAPAPAPAGQQPG